MQDYLSARWWSFQLHNLNWWRAVGILYFVVAVGMGVTAACSFLYDVSTALLALAGRRRRAYLLISLSYAVRVWDPSQPRLKRTHPRLLARNSRRGEPDGPHVLL